MDESDQTRYLKTFDTKSNLRTFQVLVARLEISATNFRDLANNRENLLSESLALITVTNNRHKMKLQDKQRTVDQITAIGFFRGNN